MKYKELEKEWTDWAILSHDTTKTAAVIYDPGTYEPLFCAFNGFPKGVKNTSTRKERPEKYKWIIHAERAAISGCAKSGISTFGKALYMHWFPCDECTKSIIAAGIMILVCDEPDLQNVELQNKWHFKESLRMLTEAGIKIEFR